MITATISSAVNRIDTEIPALKHSYEAMKAELSARRPLVIIVPAGAMAFVMGLKQAGVEAVHGITAELAKVRVYLNTELQQMAEFMLKMPQDQDIKVLTVTL